jgi:DNA-binding LytR/AlgR family response regulator
MSKPIICLVVDDEPAAQQILQQYISDTASLQLSETCHDALEAREYMSDNDIDLILLDINMPKLSGISFLKSMQDPPLVVLTTAYDDYALEGYELDVVDYLLKPFSFERFLQAISKVEGRLPDRNTNHIFVKADQKTYKISIDDIIYIESLGDYVTIHTNDKKITTYETLQNMDQQLPDSFMRIHKSYIVSLAKAEYLQRNRIIVADSKIPIGGTYRQKVKERFS